MNFSEQMRTGQMAHLHGDYENAHNLRLLAFESAQNNVDRGRAARDIAASLDRMGQPDAAAEWAQDAFVLHDEAVYEQMPGALRERAASTMYMGSIALRKAINLELTEQPSKHAQEFAVWSLRKALEDIQSHEQSQGGTIDQYRINMTGRTAFAEGLYGSRFRALTLGTKGLGLAVLSESAATSTFNLAMPFKDKIHARFNAGARAISALAATAFSFGPLRRIGLKIAQKTI